MSTFIERKNVNNCVNEMIKYISSLGKTELSKLDIQEQTKLYMIVQNYLSFPTRDNAYGYCVAMKGTLDEVIKYEIENGVIFELSDILAEVFFAPYVRVNYLITHEIVKHEK